MNQRQAPISNLLPRWLAPCVGLLLLALLVALASSNFSFSFNFERFEVKGDKVVQAPKDLTTAEFKLRTDKKPRAADELGKPKPATPEGQVQLRSKPVHGLKDIVGLTKPKPNLDEQPVNRKPDEGQPVNSTTKPITSEKPQLGSPPPVVIQKVQVPPPTADPRFEVELLVASALRLLDLNLNLMIAQRRSALTQNEGARFATLAENFGVEISQQIDRYSKLLDRLATLPTAAVFAEVSSLRDKARSEAGNNILAAGLAETHLRERIQNGKIERNTLLQDFSQSALRR